MAFYPQIPVQFQITGEHALGAEFIPAGRKLAGKLRDRMDRGEHHEYGDEQTYGLDIGRIGPEVHRGDFGVVSIEASISFGVSVVRINARPRIYEEEKKIIKKTCPQFPCFIPAIISKVSCYDSDISIGEPCDAEARKRTNGKFWYDVEFCYKDKYVLLENYYVASAGWEIYHKGQHVVLGPSAYYMYPRQWDCCVNKEPLAEEVLNPESVKMDNGYLDVYPISISSVLDGQIVKPSFPPPTEPEESPDPYYKFLASACISAKRLKEMCIQEVEVVGISNAGLKHVDVRYGTSEYQNIPVWIHTDIGTRKRAVLGEDPPAPEDFFLESALMFPLPQGTYDTNIINYSINTLPPYALALIENGLPLAVVAVVWSVNKYRYYSASVPNQLKCLPTWRPYCFINFKEKKYAVTEGESFTDWESQINSTTASRKVVYDIASNYIAMIPNQEETGLEFADSNVSNNIDNYYNNLVGLILSNDYIEHRSPFTDFGYFGISSSYSCLNLIFSNQQIDFTDVTHTDSWSVVSCTSGSSTAPYAPAYLSSELDWYVATGSTLDESTGAGYEYINRVPVYTGQTAGYHSEYSGNVTDWGPFNYPYLSNRIVFVDTGVPDEEFAIKKINDYYLIDYDGGSYELARRMKSCTKIQETTGAGVSSNPLTYYSEVFSEYSGLFAVDLIDKNTEDELMVFSHPVRDTYERLVHRQISPYTDEESKDYLEAQSIVTKETEDILTVKNNFIGKGILLAGTLSYSRVKHDEYYRKIDDIIVVQWNNNSILEKSYLRYSYDIATSGPFPILGGINNFVSAALDEFALHDDSANNYFFTGEAINYIPNSINISKMEIMLLPYDIENCDLTSSE
jgi:hypothetical protein